MTTRHPMWQQTFAYGAPPAYDPEPPYFDPRPVPNFQPMVPIVPQPNVAEVFGALLYEIRCLRGEVEKLRQAIETPKRKRRK